jgi:hypothetical protein
MLPMHKYGLSRYSVESLGLCLIFNGVDSLIGNLFSSLYGIFTPVN